MNLDSGFWFFILLGLLLCGATLLVIADGIRVGRRRFVASKPTASVPRTQAPVLNRLDRGQRGHRRRVSVPNNDAKELNTLLWINTPIAQDDVANARTRSNDLRILNRPVANAITDAQEPMHARYA